MPLSACLLLVAAVASLIAGAPSAVHKLDTDLNNVPAVCRGSIVYNNEAGNLTSYNLLKRKTTPFLVAPTDEPVAQFAFSGGNTIVYQLALCVIEGGKGEGRANRPCPVESRPPMATPPHWHTY